LHIGGTVNSHIKYIPAVFLLLAILLIPPPALAIKFDVWKTGMTLTEIVETARANNIPLTQAGVIPKDSGFSQRFINERFWKASSVGYLTKLFGVNSTVSMRISSEQPRELYEIEILMAGRMDKKQLYPKLINMLIDKYGPPDKPKRNLKTAYQWTLNDTDQIKLKLFSAPVLTYTDISYKKAAEAKSRYKYQNQGNGTIKNDADKF
jgi:hypothetical protein